MFNLFLIIKQILLHNVCTSICLEFYNREILWPTSSCNNEEIFHYFPRHLRRLQAMKMNKIMV